MSRYINFDDTWRTIKKTIKSVVSNERVLMTDWSKCCMYVKMLCYNRPESHADRLLKEMLTLLEDHVRGLSEFVFGSEVLSDPPKNNDLILRYEQAWVLYSNGCTNLNRMFTPLNRRLNQGLKLSEMEFIYAPRNVSAIAGYKDSTHPVEVGYLAMMVWKRLLVRPIELALTKRIVYSMRTNLESCMCRLWLHYTDKNRTMRGVMQIVMHSLYEIQAYGLRFPLSTYQSLVDSPRLAAPVKKSKCSPAERYERDILAGLELELALSARNVLFMAGIHCQECSELCQISSHQPLLLAEQARLERAKCQAELSTMDQLRQQHRVAHSSKCDIKTTDIRCAVRNLFETVVQMHVKYKKCFDEMFDCKLNYRDSLDKSCRAVINMRPAPDQPCRSPEILARYIDALLRKQPDNSVATFDVYELEDRLSGAIAVLYYIDDKDVFQHHYTNGLALRLMKQLSAVHKEKAMINQLKQVFDYDFTNSLHLMVADAENSTDLNNMFHKHLRKRANSCAVNMYTQMLQARVWPLRVESPPLALPRQLERVMLLYETFYHSHFRKHKITWLHHQGTVELHTHYTKKLHHITVYAPQCAMLLCYEQQDVISAAELRRNLQLPAASFLQHVRGLIHAKLLTVEGGDVETAEESCSLRLNLAFRSKRVKVHVMCQKSALRSGAPQETRPLPSTLEEDRKMYLKAAIVRIMKRRKVLEHSELVQEVATQRGLFAPTIVMIKKSIEALIEEDYLARASDGSNQYSYIE